MSGSEFPRVVVVVLHWRHYEQTRQGKWRTIKLIQQHRFSPLPENDSGYFRLNLTENSSRIRSESKRKNYHLFVCLGANPLEAGEARPTIWRR